MLDGGRKKNQSGAKVLTIIGQGARFSGDLQSKGPVRIEGGVSGTVQSDESIVVQESGLVKADLTAREIVISGKVEGNVVAHERLEVTANSTLIGDITAPRVSIAEGVVFEGKCAMNAPSEPSAPALESVQAETDGGAGGGVEKQNAREAPSA